MDITFDKIISITGKPGLYFLKNARQDGIVVKSLIDNKVQFISSRLHAFSLLENISIYTYEDSTPLREVFKNIIKLEETEEVISTNSSKTDIQDFFRKIVPEYDEDQVYISDMKKVIKWHSLLKPFNIDLEDTAPEESEEEKNTTIAE